ncbi:MAG: hypothetical protein AAGG81_06220, partial [Chlamydiota bacterium]
TFKPYEQSNLLANSFCDFWKDLDLSHTSTINEVEYIRDCALSLNSQIGELIRTTLQKSRLKNLEINLKEGPDIHYIGLIENKTEDCSYIFCQKIERKLFFVATAKKLTNNINRASKQKDKSHKVEVKFE